MMNEVKVNSNSMKKITLELVELSFKKKPEIHNLHFRTSIIIRS